MGSGGVGKMGTKTEKLRSENVKIGTKNRKKWGRKSKKMGAGRAGRPGGEGREGGKRIINKSKINN
jgi:hypothetical protein